MASAPVTIQTSHEDLIHDAQLDYYGKRLATCSSDKTIKIYDCADDGTRSQVAELKGHEGPVWQVAWAHPKFGSIIASCSYDRKVCVWKETQPNAWSKVYQYNAHESSVNSIAWCPYELGLMLACGSSDSCVSVVSHRSADDSWEPKKFHAHTIGCNAVSWAPAYTPGSVVSAAGGAGVMKRLVTGGCDNLVKVWKLNADKNEWELECQLAEHNDWVRDVAWAPSPGVPVSTIASCSQDRKVIIWTQDASNLESWGKKVIAMDAVVWRVSWSITGNILAVSGGDNKVTLWKEGADGEWECVASMDDSSSQQ